MSLVNAALLLALLVGEAPDAGLETIDEEEIEAHLRYLASPTLEGRDSPSLGLMLAAEHVAGVLRAAGLEPAADSLEEYGAAEGALPGLEGTEGPPAWSLAEEGEGTYLRPFEVGGMPTVRRKLRRPVPEECRLVLTVDDEVEELEYGVDFVPLAGQAGAAQGELVWVGFGIQSRKQRYDSLARRDVRGKVAVLLEGDPRDRREFDGPEQTAEASVWNKLDVLEEAGAAGAILVRRTPPRPEWMDEDPAPPPLGFRYTWASWNPPSTDRRRGPGVPAVEVTEACASALLGEDVADLARRLDRSRRPARVDVEGRRVAFEGVTREGDLTLPNVVGLLPGRDPEVADQVVVVGAHMDHIGVGVRGRVGLGADDNASGTSALLEVAQAMAAAPPRRTVLFAAFSGEEDGLLGSRELARDPPVPVDRIVAMVNLDMIGRGDGREVYCLGFDANPGMERVVRRAQDLGRTGIRRVERCDDRGLFQRSDHYSFHEEGIPTVFFFENYPLEQNRDYHTWRDTFDGVQVDKVTHTARLAFLTAWLLAEDDERLPAPGR